jgi:glucuronate isomerase
MNLEKATWLDYIRQLEAVAGVKIDSFATLKEALKKRMAFFHDHNCRLSDHGLNYVMYAPASEAEVERIFADRVAGKMPTLHEEDQFKHAFMLFLAAEYKRLGWVMQLHYGCRRDNNPVTFRAMGPDTGFDCVDNYAPSAQTAAFLGALDDTDELPKTILYSLNPNDNAALVTVMGAFQTGEAVGKVQHGSAWWFNDHRQGMIDQLTTLAADGYLAGFVGMLTDSRSFLSYARHEYFRRILCELLGSWVENGEYPNDENALRCIIEGICVKNAERYFDL